MKTSLYIPFTNFVINNLDGQKILYENWIQSGPAYKLVVHESPSWLKIKDETQLGEMIEVITPGKAEDYQEIVNKFFAPVTEGKEVMVNGKPSSPKNLTLDLRRALSYILIAHDYKARIYEDDILRPDSKLSDILEANKGEFSEEAIINVKFVENLLESYTNSSVPTLSVNQDAKIFKDLMDLLKKKEIEVLSEKNFALGIGKARKDICLREIKYQVTRIIKNEWLPYLVEGAVLLYYLESENEIAKALTFLSKLGAKVLSRFDLKEYAPPIQDPRLFEFGKSKGVNSFSYNPFNYDFEIYVPTLPIKGTVKPSKP